MRVLLVSAMVAGGVGGHVRMLARGLVQAGHRVVVACPTEVAERFDLAATGATVVAVEVGSGARPVQDLRAVRRLRRLAAGADVVHAHGMRAGALAVLAGAGGGARGGDGGSEVGEGGGGGGARDGGDGHAEVGARRPWATRRAPLVVTVHNAPPTDRTAALVYGALEKVVHGRADLVLGVSPDLVDRAREGRARRVGPAVVPADLTAVVPHGEHGPVRARVRQELDLDDGQLLVLTVGRLGAQKRTVEVVAAYQSLVEQETGGRRSGVREPSGARPAVVLAVAGDGPALVEVAAQAASGPGEVRLLGHRDDVAELLAAADVVVSGAQWEGQPLWLQEALGAGAVIVATDVGGTGVVVGDAAVLVPVGDLTGPEAARARVGALRRALERVIRDPGLRVELSDLARRRAAELPSAAEAVDAALAAYAEASGTAYRDGLPDRPAGPAGT